MKILAFQSVQHPYCSYQSYRRFLSIQAISISSTTSLKIYIKTVVFYQVQTTT